MRFSKELNRSLNPLPGWDAGLVLAALILAAVSIAAMSSAAVSVSPNLFLKHALWIALGLGLAWAVSLCDYRKLGDVSAVIYGMGLAGLVLVMFLGTTRLGATRWLSLFGVSVQPSELAKLATLWWLARHLAGQDEPLPVRVIMASLVIIAPPALLILAQPDLGTASVFFAIWLGMVWTAGLPGRILALFSGAFLAFLPIGWHLLHDYQRMRVLVFLDPQRDPLGSGYTIIQSTIAIGSGGLWGRGWRSGTQGQLSFLPEHHSDFIFSVIGEEWGFAGCLVVIAAFFFLLHQILRVAEKTGDPQGRLIAVGIAAWIGYQACVNMGMVMGLLPVVGVPLPFVSYGGTSMVTLWVTLGLVQSIHRYGSE